MSLFNGCVVRLPITAMLLIIIGLAVWVTSMVTGEVSRMEKSLQEKEQSIGASVVPGGGGQPRNPIVLSSHQIPADTIIDKSMIEQISLPQNLIWDDAIATSSNLLGRTTRHAIPARAQLRESDLK